MITIYIFLIINAEQLNTTEFLCSKRSEHSNFKNIVKIYVRKNLRKFKDIRTSAARFGVLRSPMRKTRMKLY
jgi:hypothetical protein